MTGRKLTKKNSLCPYFLGGITFLFQLLVVTRFKPLYFLCLGLFYIFLFYLFYSIARQIKTNLDLSFLFIIAFTFLLRLPFFFYPRGLIFTSDNALDALQTQDIASSHLPPFFLLNALQHMGTIKYTFAAFFWDIFGHNYLLYTLTQTLMYSGMLIFLYLIFKSQSAQIFRLLLVVPGFAFIETAFDNSLSLRAGSEFEMAFYFLLGAAIFDPHFGSRRRLFLAFYFISFSSYLHTLGLSFLAAFLATAWLTGWLIQSRNLFSRLILPSFAGIFLGLFHWVYYRLFVPKPPVLGGWEKINFRWPDDISLNLLRSLVLNVKSCFINLFNFEFNYLIGFFEQQQSKLWLIFLNRAIIIISAIILTTALILAIHKTILFFRKKEKAPSSWPSLFFLFLLLAFLAKTFFLEPPLLEPRHNFDLLIAVIFAYFIGFSALSQKLKDFSLRGIQAPWKKVVLTAIILIFFLQLLFTLPHYYYYLKMAGHKEELYGELLTVLSKNRVRYLETDFILAYPIYFLSYRKILVSDSIGPLTIHQFFPELRAQLARIPQEKKAYLFFGENYPSRPWHKKATAVIKTRLLKNLKEKGHLYSSIKIKYLVLIVPKNGDTNIF